MTFELEQGQSCPESNEHIYISSVESQKGATADQRCAIENQKGAIAMDFVQQ